MTTVGTDGTGYFADPSPVHLAASRGEQTQVFSGTTHAILSCTYPVTPRCFSWTPASINAAGLSAEIAAAGATITNFQNLDVYQDDAGHWHAVLAIGVHSAAHPDHWTVLVHASPEGHMSRPEATPTRWSADTLLVGSFSSDIRGNYDGKYLEDGGQLYLLYVKNFAPKPALRNGIVIQAMRSPTERASSAPVTLLEPGDRYGPLESEWYGHTQAKLVEAPSIARIAGKYALIYSTGAYQQVDYKAGVAWSDTLLPTPGSTYRKVLQPDVAGVWAGQGRPEVRYLLQSQRPRWPNFSGSDVVSPGVASVIRGPGGTVRLFFAGFDPADRPLLSPGVAQADHRRPYFVPLNVAVTTDETVAHASDVELAGWLQPERR